MCEGATHRHDLGCDRKRSRIRVRHSDGEFGRVAFAVTSCVCLGVVALMFAVRGGENWSPAFGTVWYALFVVAVVSGMIGVGVALLGRGRVRRRFIALALSLPALIAVPLFIWILVTLLPSAD